MGRNFADAACLKCGKPIRWLTGNPQVCTDCSTGKTDPVAKKLKSKAKR